MVFTHDIFTIYSLFVFHAPTALATLQWDALWVVFTQVMSCETFVDLTEITGHDSRLQVSCSCSQNSILDVSTLKDIPDCCKNVTDLFFQLCLVHLSQ